MAAAAVVLRDGGLVAFPTETFYGLGAAGRSVAAVERLVRVKGRAAGKPLLLLVDSVAMVESLAREVPPPARALMARHWPGPLTLVLPARPELPDAVTAGTGTVGVRLSSGPVARALVVALGAPIAAPSANPEGAAPPATADAVLRYFDALIDVVLDGGPTAGGEPSTVVDVTVRPPRVLRQGPIRI